MVSNVQEQDAWALLSTNNINKDIETLTQSARKSYALIEPWCQAQQTLEHPLVIQLVQDVVQQAKIYTHAIASSIDVAQQGCTFSDEAINLCKLIAERKASSENVNTFINDMITTANTVHSRAVEMNTLFRTVRVEIYQISRRIPNQVTELRERSDIVDIPAAVPLSGTEPSKQARPKEKKSLVSTIADLQEASDRLDELTKCMTVFVDWWSDMSTALTSLQSSINLMRPDGSNPMRTRAVQTQWETAKSTYIDYCNQIRAIQDYYPDVHKIEPSSAQLQQYPTTSSSRKHRRSRSTKGDTATSSDTVSNPSFSAPRTPEKLEVQDKELQKDGDGESRPLSWWRRYLCCCCCCCCCC